MSAHWKHGITEAALGSDYTDEEIAFMLAMDRYKRENHRPYPDCRDVLRVICLLGYRKQPPNPEGEGK
jgi:hypothetical protein